MASCKERNSSRIMLESFNVDPVQNVCHGYLPADRDLLDYPHALESLSPE